MENKKENQSIFFTQKEKQEKEDDINRSLIFHPIQEIQEIQTEEEFHDIQNNNHLNKKYSLIFFVYKHCDACKKYRPIQEKFYESWQNNSSFKDLANFYIIQFGSPFKSILSQFQIHSAPTIALFYNKQLIHILYHRYFQFLQTWLNEQFPDPDPIEGNLFAHMGHLAVLELHKIIRSHSTDKKKM